MDDFFPFIYTDIEKQTIEQISLFIEDYLPEYNIPEIEEEKVSIIDIL